MMDPKPNRAGSQGIVAELAAARQMMTVIVLGMSVGVLPIYSIGTFVTPIVDDLGWSQTSVVAWALAHSLGAVLSAPLVGITSDRFGPRSVALFGLASLGLVLFATAAIPSSLIMFYASGFAVGIASMGTSAIAYGRMITGRFDKGLATAFGVMSCGIGLSAGLGPKLMQFAIDSLGWRGGFLVAGAAPLALLPLAWFWLRDEATSKGAVGGAGHTLKSALRLPVFWVLAVGTALFGVCAGAMTVTLMPFLTSEGVSRSDAASLLGLMGLATLAGRLVTGLLIDRLRVNPGLFMTGAVIIQGLAFLFLGLTSTQYVLLIIPIFGLTVGAEADCVAYATAKLFGRRSYSSIFAIVGYSMLYVGSGLGPVVLNLARDHMGAYSGAYAWAAAIACLGIPLFLVISRAIATGRTLQRAMDPGESIDGPNS